MALVALLLAGCQEAPKGYVINGEVAGMPDIPTLRITASSVSKYMKKNCNLC